MSVRSPVPPNGASDRPTLYDLQIRVEDLRTWVEAKVAPGDPLRVAFDRYSEESERTGEPPSAATTAAALAAFASLPADRQREILNGWQPVDLIPILGADCGHGAVADRGRLLVERQGYGDIDPVAEIAPAYRPAGVHGSGGPQDFGQGVIELRAPDEIFRAHAHVNDHLESPCLFLIGNRSTRPAALAAAKATARPIPLDAPNTTILLSCSIHPSQTAPRARFSCSGIASVAFQ